ncbi:MAG: hypothetical protein ACRD1Z_00435, partial [Vicinamibacteria bacterium]
AKAAAEGYSLATDLADYLTSKGMPFREAHRRIGRLVAEWEEKGIRMDEITLDELRGASKLFTEDVFERLTIGRSIEARNVQGGTAPKQVRAAIARAERELEVFAHRNGLKLRVRPESEKSG